MYMFLLRLKTVRCVVHIFSFITTTLVFLYWIPLLIGSIEVKRGGESLKCCIALVGLFVCSFSVGIRLRKCWDNNYWGGKLRRRVWGVGYTEAGRYLYVIHIWGKHRLIIIIRGGKNSRIGNIAISPPINYYCWLRHTCIDVQDTILSVTHLLMNQSSGVCVLVFLVFVVWIIYYKVA